MPTKFDDVKAGDMIVADGTHDCLSPGAVRKVYADDGKRQNMYIVCDHPTETRHHLVCNIEGNLSGFYKMRHQPLSR